jgi:hypothetical protein
MLAVSGQIGLAAKAAPLRHLPGLPDFPSAPAQTVTLVWRRDRRMHLVAGLAGAVSFPLMVVAAIGTGMPFGVSSSLAVAHLAAAAPRMASDERARLSRIVCGLALLWALLCLTVAFTGAAPWLLGWEAMSSLCVAAAPFAARLRTGRSGDPDSMTGREIACLETYAGGEAVMIADKAGRLLGSTWAARRAAGLSGHEGCVDIVQFVCTADRHAFASVLGRVESSGTVESCVVTFAGDAAGEPTMLTVKPVDMGRLAIIVAGHREPADLDKPLFADPVQTARRGLLPSSDAGGAPADGGPADDGPTNVGEVVQFALRLVRRDAEKADIGLECTDAGGDIDVVCDRRALTQIVINLLNNAIKFSNHHGRVSVGVRRLPGAALIRIADRGIGIANEDQDHVFGFRGRSGDGTRQGHGLGLSIVRDLVENAGGTIVLNSELGRGTTVDIRLPLAETPACAGAEKSAGGQYQSWQMAAE